MFLRIIIIFSQYLKFKVHNYNDFELLSFNSHRYPMSIRVTGMVKIKLLHAKYYYWAAIFSGLIYFTLLS